MADYNSSYTGIQIDEGIGAARAARSASGILKSNGSGTISAAVAGTDYQTPAHVSDITLSYNGWSGSGPYTQTVTISGATITGNTKVDVQPDAAVLAKLITDGVQALFISNTNGTLTAYAVGAQPAGSSSSDNITVQVTYYDTV